MATAIVPDGPAPFYSVHFLRGAHRMALASKGSRRITVDGVAYRWVVAPNDGYMALVVERADDPGQRLEAHFDYHDVREPGEAGACRIVGQLRSISPGVTRAVILAALGRGWQASRRGLPPFRVDGESLAPIDPPAPDRC